MIMSSLFINVKSDNYFSASTGSLVRRHSKVYEYSRLPVDDLEVEKTRLQENNCIIILEEGESIVSC